MKLIIGLILICLPLISNAGFILEIEHKDVSIYDIDKYETVTSDATFGWSISPDSTEIFDVFLRYGGRTIAEGGAGSIQWELWPGPSDGLSRPYFYDPSNPYDGEPCIRCSYIAYAPVVFSNGAVGGIREFWIPFDATKSPAEIIREKGRGLATVFAFYTHEGRSFEMSMSPHAATIKSVSVPEPFSISLLALGLAAIGIRRRLR